MQSSSWFGGCVREGKGISNLNWIICFYQIQCLCGHFIEKILFILSSLVSLIRDFLNIDLNNQHMFSFDSMKNA